MPAKKQTRRTSKSTSRGKSSAGATTRRIGRHSDKKKPVKKRTPKIRGNKPAPAKRNDGKERLQKLIAASGIASRRECEALILEGRVEVDGTVVDELGTRVNPKEHEIRVDGVSLRKPRTATYAVHKPPGYVSTAKDPKARPRVIDLLPPDVGRVYNVGRLDISSEGLILVTNDGELANLITHPRHGIEKTYHVTVVGNVDRGITRQLVEGVHLAEGFARASRAKIRKRHKAASVLEIVLAEGRNREIRRLLAKLGHKVVRLVRVSIGPIRLGEMPRGSARLLLPEEIKALRRVAERGPKPVVKKTTDEKTPTRSARTIEIAPKVDSPKKGTTGRRLIGLDIDKDEKPSKKSTRKAASPKKKPYSKTTGSRTAKTTTKRKTSKGSSAKSKKTNAKGSRGGARNTGGRKR